MQFANHIKIRFASLPKPKETDWELELPEEKSETNGDVELSEEDAAERDQRNQAIREAAERAELKRRTQVLQRKLPRPSIVDIDALLKNASEIPDPYESAVAKEVALLVANDALKYPDPEDPITVHGSSQPLDTFDDDTLNKARLEIALEMPSSGGEERQQALQQIWAKIDSSLPGLSAYSDDDEPPPSTQNQTLNVTPPPSLPPLPPLPKFFFLQTPH